MLKLYEIEFFPEGHLVLELGVQSLLDYFLPGRLFALECVADVNADNTILLGREFEVKIPDVLPIGLLP